MNSRSTVFPLLVALHGFLVFGVTASAKDTPVVVSNDQYGYSVRIPKGWVQVPADVLGTFAKSILEPDGKVIFEAAFQPDGLENWFQYPYVLIQVTPYDRVGLEHKPTMPEIKKFVKELSGFDADAQKDSLTDAAREMLSETSYQKAQFDEKTLRIAYDADLEKPDGGTVRGRALGQFGRTAFVQVVFYDFVSRWPSREEARKSILQSLAFKPDSVLTVGSSSGMNASGDHTGTEIILGGLGVVLVVIIAVAILGGKKQKSAA